MTTNVLIGHRKVGTFRMSSDLAHIPEHTKVVIALIGRTQSTVFGAHSVADIETLVDKNFFDLNMIRL